MPIDDRDDRRTPSNAPEELVMERSDAQRRSLWLGEAIDTLNEREQLIIRERRLREDSITLEALGSRLGISKAVSYTHLTLPTILRV